MEKYEREFRRNHDSVRSYNREGDRNQPFENYQSRYQDHGNYFGMPDSDSTYDNVRSTQGRTGRTGSSSTSGPVGGYGANNYHDDDRRNNWQQNSNRSNQSGNTYGSGSGRGQSSGYSGSRGNSNSDQYRYGDPNPYMNNQRNGGYERTRGTGWRSESDSYEGTDYGNSRYSRQDNSYIAGGEGRRYESFGRDEEDNYGHNRRNRLDHGHTDRNEHDRRRSDNDYSPERQYGNSSNRAGSSRPEWRNVSDKYNRNRDQHLFDHTDDDYPRSSRYDRHRSGPDWSADSAASDYSPGDLRG